MHTLLLRITGPMQSWGINSRFHIRETNLAPTKSGIVGLCCSALGWDRSKDITQFSKLRMGVRIDNAGQMHKDFQTIQNVLTANGKKKNLTSERYYISDAFFIVALEGDDLQFLKTIQNALAHPIHCIYLGRKSYVPSRPLYIKDGLLENQNLMEVLKNFPVDKELTNRKKKSPEYLTLIREVEQEKADKSQYDQILPYSFMDRKFGKRSIKIEYIPSPQIEIGGK